MTRIHYHDYKLIFCEDGCPSNEHDHDYSGETSFDVGHMHYLSGKTDCGLNQPQHVHNYKGTTTFDDGHVHYFEGDTGRAIPTPGGGHYHEIKGTTTVNGAVPHTHYYQGIAK